MFTAIFWRKVWIWLRHHWYWPVIIVLMILSLAACGLGRAPQKLFGLLKKQKESYEKEIQIVKEEAMEAKKKKAEIFVEHEKELERIEEEHEIQLSELENKKEEELASTVERAKEDPEDLARKVAEVLSADFQKK